MLKVIRLIIARLSGKDYKFFYSWEARAHQRRAEQTRQAAHFACPLKRGW